MIRFISLFTGIGGLDLGLERAGMECVAQVEIDDFCQKVLTKHWPSVPKFKDARDVGKDNLPSADLICGGFPCQPHSLAGKRKGEEDDRNLWPEYFRIIKELKPTWVVGENVPGIRTTILDKVLSDLESEDYSTVTLDIPACAFNARHRRHRYFIIAHAKSNEGWISAIARKQEEEILIGRVGEKGVITNPDSKGLQTRDESRTFREKNERTKSKFTRSYSVFDWEHPIEPTICGMVDGVPDRVDRNKSLGNAVVPQVAEFIGLAIVEAHKEIFE